MRALRGHRGRRRVREALRVPGFGGERAAPRVPRARRARHYGPVQLRRHARGLRRGRDRAAFQFSLRRCPEPAPAPPPRARRWLPLDESGKAFGFREPREGEAERRAEGQTRHRREKKRSTSSTRTKYWRIARRTSRCSSRGGGRLRRIRTVARLRGLPHRPSLLEVDERLSASVSHRSQGEKTNGNGSENGNGNENDSNRSGWRPLRQLVTTMAAFGARRERRAPSEAPATPGARHAFGRARRRTSGLEPESTRTSERGATPARRCWRKSRRDRGANREAVKEQPG